MNVIKNIKNINIREKEKEKIISKSIRISVNVVAPKNELDTLILRVSFLLLKSKKSNYLVFVLVLSCNIVEISNAASILLFLVCIIQG